MLHVIREFGYDYQNDDDKGKPSPTPTTSDVNEKIVVKLFLFQQEIVIEMPARVAFLVFSSTYIIKKTR